MLKNADMPKADALIEYSDGFIGAAMFHYTAETADVEATARDNGFEITGYYMPDDHPLMKEYAEGSGEAIGKWKPEPPSIDWKLGGKHDTDDGPYAYFLRPTPLLRKTRALAGESLGQQSSTARKDQGTHHHRGSHKS